MNSEGRILVQTSKEILMCDARKNLSFYSNKHFMYEAGQSGSLRLYQRFKRI